MLGPIVSCALGGGYPAAMTRQDKLVAAVVVAPYLIFLLGLVGWIAWRTSMGAPLPHGAAAVGIGFCCLTPAVMLATAAVFRWRGRGPQGPMSGSDP